MLAIAKVVAMFQVLAEAAFGPTFGASHGFNVIFVGVGEGSEFVERHVDVGADLALDLHRFFGANEIGLAVEGIGEVDACFGNVGEAFFVGGVSDAAFFFHGNDFAETGAERHNLEAARVGQGGFLPGGIVKTILTGGLPLGEAALFGDFGGLAAEVIAVGEHSLGASGI